MRFEPEVDRTDSRNEQSIICGQTRNSTPPITANLRQLRSRTQGTATSIAVMRMRIDDGSGTYDGGITAA